MLSTSASASIIQHLVQQAAGPELWCSAELEPQNLHAASQKSSFKSGGGRVTLTVHIHFAYYVTVDQLFCSSGFLHHCQLRRSAASFSGLETGLSPGPSVTSLQVILKKKKKLHLLSSSCSWWAGPVYFSISHCGNRFKATYAISHGSEPEQVPLCSQSSPLRGTKRARKDDSFDGNSREEEGFQSEVRRERHAQGLIGSVVSLRHR